MDTPISPESALRLAVDRLGSQAEMARLCRISQPAVHKWLRNRAQLPAEHVLAVEAATGISRHVLRPDIYPIELGAPGAIPAQVREALSGIRPGEAPAANSSPAAGDIEPKVSAA